MEQQLSGQNVDIKKWLESQTQQVGQDQVELHLTELLFNLQVLQSQAEENVLNSQQQIEEKRNQIFQQSDTILSHFQEINEYLNSSLSEQKIQQLSLNECLFSEINEMVNFKNKLNSSLEMLDIVMALDFHYEEVRAIIEEANLQELQKKLENINETLLVLLRLPKVNPRYEKAERIVSLIIDFIKKFSSEKYDKERGKICKELSTVYQILNLLQLQQEFFNLYKSCRLDKIIAVDLKAHFASYLISSQAGNNNSQNSNQNQQQIIQPNTPYELGQIVEIACNLIQKEADFLTEFQSLNLQKVQSQLFKEFLILISKYMHDNFFFRLFADNFTQYSSNTILEHHKIWLNFIRYINKQSDLGNINNEDMSLLSKEVLKPYIKSASKIIEFEQQHLGQIFLKKQTKDQQYNMMEYQEKILDWDFLWLIDLVENSFKRTNECTFSTEIDDWRIKISTNIEEFLQKFDRLLQEIDQNEFQCEQLEKIISFTGTNISSTSNSRIMANMQEEISLGEDKKSKIQLKKHLPVLESLIGKIEEIMWFEKQLERLDKEFRSILIENDSIFFKSLFKQIQFFILQSQEQQQKNRNSLIFSIKNGELIFENVYAIIDRLKDRIKKIILKLLLSESYNQLISYLALKLWNSKEEAEKYFSYSNASEQITFVGQHFFLHVEQLEGIKNSLRNNSLVNDFIEQKDKNSVFDMLYFNQIKQEQQYLLIQAIDLDLMKNKIDFIKYWSLLYIHFIAKIFLICLKNLAKITTDKGIKQMKSDIEYFINLFNNFGEESNTVEELSSILKLFDKGGSQITF